MGATIGVGKVPTQLVEQDGLQDGKKQPVRNSSGQFVAGNKANPTGKGGFGDRSNSINRKGRPKKGFSWAEILNEVAEKIVPGSDEKSFKEAVAHRLYLEAVNGNIRAMCLIFNRMEGSPKRIEPAYPSMIDDHSDEIAQLLQEMHKIAHAEELEG